MAAYKTPYLPGYVDNSTRPGFKKQSLNYSGAGMGVSFGKEGDQPVFFTNVPGANKLDPDVVRSKAAEAAARREDLSAVTSGMSSMSTYHIVTFTGYWREDLAIGTFSHRVRHFKISMTLEDGEITILEQKESNSGLPQGAFLKKHKVPKEGGYLQIQDILVGSDVVVYGRKFHIFKCDPMSRALLATRGLDCPADEPCPSDPAVAASATQVVDTQANVSFKKYNEAQLGKSVEATTKLGDFLEFNDAPPLRFFAVWRDDRLYGKLNRYTINFFLEDRTFQIRDIIEDNSGTDQFHNVYKRATIVKNYRIDSQAIGRQKEGSDIYDATDMYIGNTIDLFGKKLLLTNCNEYTRGWFGNMSRRRPGQFRQQPQPIVLPEDAAPAKPAAQVPVRHMGGVVTFGSEVDSLNSCKSLHPTKVKDDPEKVKSNEKHALKFGATMISEKPEDQDRTFVVAFYLFDDTVSVFECALKNSGIVPGKFLKRSLLRNRAGEYYSINDFFVGADLTINTFKFHLCDMDTFTANYAMNRPKMFPWADMERLLGDVLRVCNSGQAIIAGQRAQAGRGDIHEPQFKDFCQTACGMSSGEAICAARFFFYGGQELSFEELREFLQLRPEHLTNLISADTCDTVLADSLLDKETRILKKSVMKVREGFSNERVQFEAMLNAKADDMKNLTKAHFRTCLYEAKYSSNVPYGAADVDLIVNYFFPPQSKTKFVSTVNLQRFLFRSR